MYKRQLSDCDAYVNIAGGIRMNEPAIDLGIVLAIASSKMDIIVREDTICFGEVGLSGEAVSYTHLDVYKRQAIFQTLQLFTISIQDGHLRL